jgi:hypothetical protein
MINPAMTTNSAKPLRNAITSTAPLASRRGVGIDAALDLGNPFGVAVNHASDCDRATNDDSNDRN